MQASDKFSFSVLTLFGTNPVTPAKTTSDNSVGVPVASVICRDPINYESLTVGTSLGVRLVYEVHEVEEPTAFAVPDAGSRDVDREMRFTDSRAAN